MTDHGHRMRTLLCLTALLLSCLAFAACSTSLYEAGIYGPSLMMGLLSVGIGAILVVFVLMEREG